MTETDFVNVKRNKFSNEPYLFFSPNNSRTIFLREDFHRYYQYLAFNSGFGNSKKAIFYNSNPLKRIEINEIEKNALNKLKDFILEQRDQDPTFCETIYTAIEAELSRR